jgi:hypothetical protein
MASATDSDHWNRLEKLFYQALDLEPAARIAFLNQACGDNATLRKEVESLLISSDKTFSFLQKPIEVTANGSDPISSSACWVRVEWERSTWPRARITSTSRKSPSS